MDQLGEDDKKPVTRSEVKKEMGNMLKSHAKIKRKLYQKPKRILTIEQETVLGIRMMCPASWRPYEAYALSSNGVFEFARF